jgi:hypothetical protein
LHEQGRACVCSEVWPKRRLLDVFLPGYFMQPSPSQRSSFTKPASSAAQPASDLTGNRAVGAFHTIGNTKILHRFFSPGDRLPQISDIFGDGALLQLLWVLSPQCLLNLSAGSRALRCHATCDDVYRVVICGSLLADSFCVLTHKPRSSRRADA